MLITPMFDRVIIKKVPFDTMTKGGLFIPDAVKEKPFLGDIVSCGPGKRTEAGQFLPMTLKRGDRVLFGKYAGSEVEIDGEKLLLLKEEDVLGIVSDGD